MATNTFEAFYLGIFSDIDPGEANFQAENAGSLVGESFGSSGSPLHASIDSVTTDDADNDGIIRTNSNGQTGEDISYDGVTSTFDGVATYNATITYSDGTTDTVEVVIMQDELGRTFLAPWASGNSNNIPLGAKPIVSISLDTLALDTGIGTSVTQDNDVFVDGTVDGTSGDDNIGTSYTDADGTQMNAYGGDDTVDAGAGNDTVRGGSGDDLIYGGNGVDSLRGGNGSDTLFGGDGDDSLDGDNGDDSLSGGAGDDYIRAYGDEGTDTLDGGSGTDTVEFFDDSTDDGVDLTYSGDGTGTYLFQESGNGGTFTSVEYVIGTEYADNLDASGDSVGVTFDGDRGDDVMTGGTGADWLFGDEDADSVIINDDFGDDTIIGGEGVFYSTDDDTIDLSNLSGPVTITYSGNEAGTITDGSDTITFSEIEAIILTDGNDSVASAADSVGINIDSGDGADSISGTSVADSIDGGSGSDTIDGGAGSDSIDLGADSDRDTVVTSDGSGSDTVTNFDMTDFGDGTTTDRFDVSGLTNAGGDPVTVHDVVVTDTNGDGTGDAILTFPNGESVTLHGVLPSQVDGDSELKAMGIPCFTSGTMIATPNGEIAVEVLRPGDLVSTVEHGPLPVRWCAQSDFGDGMTSLPDKLVPVRIKSGNLGNHRPLIVSPQHCILMQTRDGAAKFYVRAKHLAQETDLASFARGRRYVSYVHVLLDRHATLISNDIPSESFYPGPFGLELLTTFDRMMLYALFPPLTGTTVEKAYGARAADVLTRKDVRKIINGGILECADTRRIMA